MNRDLIPKYTLRGESYIDFHGLRYKTYIFSFKAKEILNTVSLNHLYKGNLLMLCKLNNL